jgi:small GTP-binding protein
MEAILSAEQQQLLKRTRETLGDVRDTLAGAGAGKADRDALADSMRQLDELFLLVIAGEFNAGKSTFINALLGLPNLLLEGVTPTTSQIYLLKHGETAEQAPREKGVWVQTAPVELLRNINIVDTPGTNAILREHETLTADFIPRSDLVLFLTSADRPFSESERAFLSRIRDWGKKIVLVVNKIDLLNEEAGEHDKVVEFVTQSARTLVGDIAAVYAVSARLALKAKSGQPQLWEQSGFEPLEAFIEKTLDDIGRFRLKLLNPLGVGVKLVHKQLEASQGDWDLLEADSQLLGDIEAQMDFFKEDMERNFEARLSEINNLLYEMERRGNNFFDETIRIGRVPDLMKKKYLEEAFEREVVGETPELLENRISELVDWLVEQDLRQWTSVSDHLSRRRQDVDHRLVGQTGPREGTLAYDRQRLIDSIGKSTQKTIRGYDKDREAERIVATAREAVVGLTASGVGAGLGLALVVATTAPWIDFTGLLAGLSAVTLGLFVFPTRRRKAKKELTTAVESLRLDLVANLREQFDREMRRSVQRIEDIVSPFSRFVRSERAKIEEQRHTLIEQEAHLLGLQQQVQGL